MELKLEDGRYVPGRYQGFDRVEGIQELLQRILMKLRTRRGAFLPMSDYGSRLHTLSSVKPSLREAAAKQFVLEALTDEKGLELQELTLYSQEDEIRLELSFFYNGNINFTVETII